MNVSTYTKSHDLNEMEMPEALLCHLYKKTLQQLPTMAYINIISVASSPQILESSDNLRHLIKHTQPIPETM